MGRAEAPICDEDRNLRPLALWLREQRQRAGLSFTELSKSTGLSPRTLSRASSGRALPTLPVVERYAAGCRADAARARKLWKSARLGAASRDGVHHEADGDTLRPEYIVNFAQLRAAMIELRALAGDPTLRELEERAGSGMLPRSTVNLILRGRGRPRRDVLRAFVGACGVRESQVPAWDQAWLRAQSQKMAIGKSTSAAVRHYPGVVIVEDQSDAARRQELLRQMEQSAATRAHVRMRLEELAPTEFEAVLRAEQEAVRATELEAAMAALRLTSRPSGRPRPASVRPRWLCMPIPKLSGWPRPANTTPQWLRLAVPRWNTRRHGLVRRWRLRGMPRKRGIVRRWRS